MSKMSELYIKVSSDPALLAKLQGILDAQSGGDAESAKAALLSFAREEGSDVTWEEIQAFFKDISEQPSKALSEAELDMVAGGKDELTPFQIMSIVTLGLLCGTTSAVVAAFQGPDQCKLVLENY